MGKINQIQVGSSTYDIEDAGAQRKVPGKGLSTNDYTDEEKSRVASTVTKTVNDLVNYYLKSQTYSKEEVQALIAAVKQFTYELVAQLPAASAATMHKIYLVPAEDAQQQNIKDEYITILVDGAYVWEHIGSTAIDLSNYYTMQQTDTQISTALSSALAAYTTTESLTLLLSAYRTASDQDEIDAGKESKHPYISLERLQEYLYRVTFDSLPEDNGGDSPVGGGCSAFVREGKLHRNYDFNYDNAASFIVRTKDFEGMAMLTGLNDGQMDDAMIAKLPYRMVDGRNNNGIMVSVHLLFNDWQYSGAGSKSIPMTKLPFEVLSRVKSMATIGTDLADVLGNLAVTTGMGDYLLQCLVTDGTTTYAIIPPDTDNSAYALINATAYPKMSNFRYVARAEVSRNDMDIQDRPTGIERYNLMPCELSDLRFTKAYEASDRLSEFIGIDDTSKTSTDAELTAIYNTARAEYLTRERDGKTWQTMHSVVYGSKMESLFIQEDWADDILGDYIEKPSSFTPGHLAALDSDGNLEDSETGLDISKKYGRKNGQWVEITEGGSGTSDFDELNNRPKYNGAAMTHSTDIPAVPSQLSQLSGDITHRTVTDAEKAGWDAKQDDISGLIPAQASAQNQLADKNFVNSSVQTAAANFRGNWVTKSAIPTDYTQYPADYAGNKKPTTNDYLVVQADESQDGGTWRYKYSGVWDTDGVSGWNAEYEVNETPLTAAQLAALNSGITAAAVAQIATNTTDIAGKQDALTFDSTPTASSTNPVTSGGVKSYVDGIVGDIENLLAAI